MFDAKSQLLATVLADETSSEPLTVEDLGDLELAALAGRGNEAAYTALFEKHQRRTSSLCTRIVSAADVPDLNQDVWIQVFKKISSFRGESSFTTWLHRLTVNQCLMHLRKRYVRLERVADDEEDFLRRAEIALNNVRHSPSVLDSIALRDAMAGLPDGYRSVLHLHDVLGFEHEEVAAILGCSVGTSKSQLHKARLKMARLLRQKKFNVNSEGFMEKRYIAKLGIELPAVSRMDFERGVELAIEEEQDDYEMWSEEEQ